MNTRYTIVEIECCSSNDYIIIDDRQCACSSLVSGP